MSILDSIKSVASEGLHLAGSVEKMAEDGLGSLVHAGEKAVSTAVSLPGLALQSTEDEAKKLISGAGSLAGSLATTVSSFLPGIAEAKSLVSIGENVFKSSTSGDIFKVAATTSMASMIPGLGALVGAAAVANAVTSDAQPKKKDDIFKYVSTDEWKQIISAKENANKGDTPAASTATTATGAGAEKSAKPTEAKQTTVASVDGIVPKAHVDANGVEFQRTAYDTKLPKTGDAQTEAGKPGQTKIEGNTATHTEADGTVTTQTGGHTEIQHGDRKIVKDTAAGVVQEVVGDRVAYEQNTNTNTQAWNTKQGVRVVEENGEYKIFNKDGTLIGTRPVSVIASELQEENQTLINGDQMRRHLSGGMMDHCNSARRVVASGKEWDVYSDGVSRTLSSGETVGMMASSDAFVQIGKTTIVRKAQDRKIYMIEDGGASQEVDVNSDKITAPVKAAITMLSGIDQDNKLHLGDGAFLTVRDGKVVGGTDEIVDEPVPAPTGFIPSLVHPVTPATTPTKVEVTMVTTGANTSTSTLLGGYQSTYEWDTHKSTIAEPEPKDHKPGDKPRPIVVIDDKSLSTDDVITTKQGTTDRVTNDFIGHDGSIATSNGIKVSADNDIQFADGTKFAHDGTVTLADGRIARAGSDQESVAQQATSALATAMSIASAVAGKAANGTITFGDIALLQSSICDVQGLIGACMNSGNLEVAQSLMKTGASLQAALDSANTSLSQKTIRSTLTANTANIDTTKYSFLQTRRAA
ncbi:MAG: hypothetical protein JST89_10660 [Cyanobacteria bacterium SZAS-4]|nr:hypothetical protein [Cyanobacteria bacterium SZAS-4]